MAGKQGMDNGAALPTSGADPRARWRRWWRRWGPSLRCFVTAGAAWVITVAPMATGGKAGAVERVLAALSLLAGLSAPVLVVDRPRLARQAGLTGFVGLALLTWVATSTARGLPALDTYRALLGALAWALYALSWSHPYSTPISGSPDGTAVDEPRVLSPRRRTPPFAWGVALVGALGAAVCLGLGWRVDEPSRAVLAQVLAVAAAVALLAAASTLTVLGARRAGSSRRARQWRPWSMRPVVRSLVLVVALASIVAVLLVDRC